MGGETHRLRSLILSVDSLTSEDNYIDYGIELRTVRQDENGEEVLLGRPRVSVVQTEVFGGLLDVRTREFVGPSPNPYVLYASEAQAPIIRHESGPPRVLCFGAEGAGKTALLARWLVLRALEFTGQGVEIGATAPTARRVTTVARALMEVMPDDWYTYHVHESMFRLHNGVTIRLAATKQYSEAVGSPIQGWDWAAAASDELNDSLSANDDIEARGRRAPGGVYRRLCTATAKDSTEWRNQRDRFAKNPLWAIERMQGSTNVFVHSQHWENLRTVLDERAYRRRVLAQDVGPERAVYPQWNRETNLRPVPQLGAVDVTSKILRGYGNNLSMLIGCDPGLLQDVSICLKAFVLPRERGHTWFVVDEVTTTGTTEEHVLALRTRLREKWGINMPDPYGRGPVDELGQRAHVRCDPYGDNDQRPDRSVHQTFKRFGIDIRSAAYKNGKGSGRVPKEAGIEMVNRLLKSASGKTRLYVACDDMRKACAPKLVESLEMSERDEAGKAENQKKNARDLSHWTAALRYGLYFCERTVDVAEAQA